MLMDVEQVTISLVGDTSRTLKTYAHSTNRTLHDVVNEALEDWAETVAKARLDVTREIEFEAEMEGRIHLVTK